MNPRIGRSQKSCLIFRVKLSELTHTLLPLSPFLQIIEGSRKRARLEVDANSNFANSPASSASRLPDVASSNAGPSAEEATQLGFKLLDVLINRIDEDDTPLTVPFLALPLRSDYPDYYELIKNPVSIEQIRRRLQSRSFATFEQVKNALESICRNAKRYNQKGSEIYEKSRTMHQIIHHAYIDLVEKGDVQPLGNFILKSDPPLQQQSDQLAKVETPSRRARLDYDELEDEDVVGRISLRIKKDDDIPYDEDEDEEGVEQEKPTEDQSVPQETKNISAQQQPSNGNVPKVEKSTTPRAEASMDLDDMDEGDLSSAPMYEAELEVLHGKRLDRSMLTLAGKFDRRKRPGPRGKRLKSTLRHLVGELKNVLDRNGQPITRFFLWLPSRLQYPDYYKVIQRPIALDSIEDKVNRKDYANPHALVTDLRQMVENAQYYNEEGSEVWEAAEEIRQYVEGTTIPTLLADGFTLDPDDMRQSALPVEIAANSTVPAQAAAFRIQAERRRALENGTSTEFMESVSPEPAARSLSGMNDNKLKVRLNPRGNTSTSPIPLGGELLPPPAPPGAGPGLSGHDGQAQMLIPKGSTPTAGVGYTPPPGISATPSSYLLPTSSPGNAPLPWTTPSGNNGLHPSPGTLGNNSYFAQYSPGLASQAQIPSRLLSSSMAPPNAMAYSDGSLPFQKPTNVQMQGVPNESATALNVTPGTMVGDAARLSLQLSKRLTGEGPLFDPFRTNFLEVDSETTIVRHAVISYFDVRIQNKEQAIESENLRYRLMNDVTRLHSVNIVSESPDSMECTIEMIPKDINPRKGQTEGEEKRQWTFSIHHNGKGIKPRWKGQDHVNGTTKAITEMANPATANRVQISAGTPCYFSFAPTSGVNTVSIHIHPPPPISALQEIVHEEKNPLRSKAKALLDLPERYRIFINCR